MSSQIRHRQETVSDLADLVSKLESKDWQERHEARLKLVAMGRRAAPLLIRSLLRGKKEARWEAAKALGQLKDPASTQPLVLALMDRSFEVQWLAAEALVTIGPETLPALYRALSEHPEVDSLRRGAHHVLSEFNHRHILTEEAKQVLREVGSPDEWGNVVIAVRRAMAPAPTSQAKSSV